MSDLGNLSQCMVDNDPEVRARARRLRQKALVVSLCIEAVCLGGMLLWPLITPGVLPTGFLVTPVPPYHGGGGGAKPHVQRPHRQTDPVPHLPTAGLTYHPSDAHRQTQPYDESAPNVSDDIGTGPGLGPGPIGPVVPGGNDHGPAIAPPPPADGARPARRTVSAGVMESALVHRVEPIYPVIARTMHLSGVVRLRAIISTDGSVQNLEVLSGSPILARSAEEAVRQWRYRPTLLNGVPVEVETYITVAFVLGSQ